MREHQIVISLKPEQFEEVQRLARAAGSKSISAFLRQQIVASLGLGNSVGPVPTVAGGPDMKQLTGELRRLHRELQIFVADSISNNECNSTAAVMETSLPFPTAVQENFLAEGAPLIPESSYTQASLPQPETYSGAPPPIMPVTPMLPGQVSQALERGASVFSSSSFSLPTTSGYEDAPDEVAAYSIAKQATEANSAQAPYAVPPSPGQPPYAIPPIVSHPHEDFENSIPAPTASVPNEKLPYTVPEAPPEPAEVAPAVQTAEVQAPAPQSSPSAAQGFAENDELEDLADRAFAISPRLGPLSDAVRKFPDPLKDLLDDAFLNGLEDESPELTDEQESTPAAQPETVVVEEELEDFPEEPPAMTEPKQLGSQSYADELPPKEEDVPTIVEAADEESAAQEGEEESQDPPPQIPPPISGGPPPRKRRT